MLIKPDLPFDYRSYQNIHLCNGGIGIRKYGAKYLKKPHLRRQTLVFLILQRESEEKLKNCGDGFFCFKGHFLSV